MENTNATLKGEYPKPRRFFSLFRTILTNQKNGYPS